MIHYFIGNLGHTLVISSFVFSLMAAFSYLKYSLTDNIERKAEWKSNGRFFFFLHTVAVMGTIYALFHIIYNNYFEYHYAYSHASSRLPVHYMISCFWEGQEGSFLLWIFWNVWLGLAVIFTSGKWEGPIMTIFALVQAFLTSMILGTVLGLKIGSSPFMLLRDVMDAPVFGINPEFIPEDGTGLNPLLQNYWMVIHPPVLFLGYASTLVPFSFAIAGLWLRKFGDWVKVAMPWMVFSALMMALGQIMGAYWAYETLSFGGYWSWDPVENAVYVPWVIQLAAIHTMIIYNRRSSALKTSIILVISTFLLVLYATFLTRSGILGNASVHSFTDLGLSGQLLIYLLAFFAISIWLVSIRWKELPKSTDEKDLTAYNSEFWIFIGAIVLCLMAFQVIIPTSFPVFNKIAEVFGITSNLAPPAEQAIFYSKFQIWGGMLLAIGSGAGQYFWWIKVKKVGAGQVFAVPLMITMVLSGIIMVIGGVNKFSYIILLTTSLFAIVSNGQSLWRLGKKNFKLSGGSVSHIGIALMLIGILFSAGYSKVISLNHSGMKFSDTFSDEMNQENVLLYMGEERQMAEYKIRYNGKRIETTDGGYLIKLEDLAKTDEDFLVRAKKDIVIDGEQLYDMGDTIDIMPENVYYEIQYTRADGDSFTLYPRAQANPNMGLLVSPAILKKWDRDMYTHISTIPDPDSETEWSEPDTLHLHMGQQFFVNDYVATLDNVERIYELMDLDLTQMDVAVKANITVKVADNKDITLSPVFVVKEKMVGNIPDMSEEFGVKIAFLNIQPEQGSFELLTYRTQKDYIIMKAIEMPHINLLWIGSIVMMIGMGISVYRRTKAVMVMK